jgi:tetratricopeptide (TPR) repeat protein
MLLAVLTKEFALAFIPGVAFLAYSFQSHKSISLSRTQITGISIVVVSVAVLFFLLRAASFSSNSTRIGMTLKFLFVDPLHTVKVFAGTFAFYLKKIFIPWPLNFAIVEIDPLYELLAIPLLIICLLALYKRDTASAFFLTGVLLFTPAFVIAFNQIAWTPYAERYVYVSAAFVLIGTLQYIWQRWGATKSRIIYVVLGCYLIVFAGTTYARNKTWSSNEALFADTVQKSPNTPGIRLTYGSLLAEAGKYDEALLQFEIGKKMPQISYDDRFDLNIAAVYERQGKRDKLIEQLEYVVKKSKGKSVKAINELISIFEKKQTKSQNETERLYATKRIQELKELLAPKGK